ncbi:hypothetical protein [Rubrimonas cliftonensis]|uniref:hypothetical protein n=1 Tax=Rubrimonas cliftonensis TaxID=89524 RepID=UPI001C3181EF|nr:hypothetical protein [Rubrimonas cliftonensis]
MKIVAGALSGFFVVTGLLWLVVPDFVARQMRMELLTGDGLTTQIGDLAAFFLTLGGSIAIALITMRSVWLYPPVMLLSFAAAGRLIAWSVHGAGLTLDMIVFEIVAAALLVFTAERMPEAGR